MIHQFYISTTALSAYQKVMVNITNNIANAQTPGFKSSRVELEALFPGVLEESMNQADEMFRVSDKKKKRVYYGTGVKIADVIRDFRQGRLEITNQPFDVAIQGDGFFRFKLPDGTVAYGRAGNLQKNRDGHLVDPNGNLLDPPIRIPINSTAVNIDREGRVFVQVDNELESREIGQILLSKFDNPNALQSIGHNLYLETSLSGTARVHTPGREGAGSIAQNSLEFSNVNVVNEMMKMVIIQRSFELAAKAIKSGEQMLEAAESIAKGS